MRRSVVGRVAYDVSDNAVSASAMVKRLKTFVGSMAQRHIQKI
jgi:hypothetical protein